MFFPSILVAAIFAAYPMYQQCFAWERGLDAAGSEFQTDWMTMVKIQIPVLFDASFLC